MTSTIVELVSGFDQDIYNRLEKKRTDLRSQYATRVRPIHTSMTSQIIEGEPYIWMAITLEIGG